MSDEKKATEPDDILNPKPSSVPKKRPTADRLKQIRKMGAEALKQDEDDNSDWMQEAPYQP